MPRIVIDGQERMASANHTHATMGELLTELVTVLADSQKMIREVSIDGIAITESSLPQAADRQTAAVGTVELRTMTYRELARFGLERATLLVQEVIRGAEQVAKGFRVKSQEEANRAYMAWLEDLQLFVDMVEQVLKLTDRPAHFPPTPPSPAPGGGATIYPSPAPGGGATIYPSPAPGGGATIYPSPARGEGQGGGEASNGGGNGQGKGLLGDHLKQLGVVTGQLLSAHQRDDVMVLADLLAYDLIPLLRAVQGALRTLEP